ncbi:pentapeptide repeat-containing protein [Flavitalea sp.]
MFSTTDQRYPLQGFHDFHHRDCNSYFLRPLRQWIHWHHLIPSRGYLNHYRAFYYYYSFAHSRNYPIHQGVILFPCCKYHHHFHKLVREIFHLLHCDLVHCDLDQCDLVHCDLVYWDLVHCDLHSFYFLLA